MRPGPSHLRLLAAALLGAVAALSGSAPAGAANPQNQARLERTVRFLQNSQQPNGGFAQSGEPSQGTTAWVTFALAAAGINPQDQARPGGTDAYGFLVAHFHEGLEEELAWPQISTTAFERELLVIDAAGTDPHHFAGFDLVNEILARKNDDGSFPYVAGGQGEINDTVFAILALSLVDEPEARAAVQAGADWLIAQQNEDGGWSWGVKGNSSETDLTGAAIEALVAAGRADSEAVHDGLQYLREAQLPDGGFPETPGGEGESNVASTAWSVQGIWAAGENPEAWSVGSAPEAREPLGYMESLQELDGHLRWRRSSDVNGVWMTAYAAPAFAGQALPIPAVPRSPEADPGDANSGQGGESRKPGDGVIAGGGGSGAPLFSRPKPQSKGRTPGGARVVRNKGLHPTDHSETRRGENTRQPTGTEASEPSAAEAVAAEGGAVGAGFGSEASGPGASEASPTTAGTGSGSPGPGGSPFPPPLGGHDRSGNSAGGREVSGVLVGAGAADPGDLAFGAPGLHGAGAGIGQSPGAPIAIAAAALALGILGAQRERRRQELVA
jgi:hypothetical protein